MLENESQIQPINYSPPLLHLFASFLKLGLTSFGGPAMVAYIRKMAVEQKNWLDDGSFRQGVAICQTIPGATAMQTAAYVGLRLRGIRGAAASFIGFGLPAFCLMMTLSALYVRTHNLPIVASVFNGLQAIIVAIIANATASFAKSYLKDWKNLTIFLIAAIMFWWRINPISVILLAGFLGLFLKSKQLLDMPTSHIARKLYSTRHLVFTVLGASVGILLLFFANPQLFKLAALMFRIDLFAFGGGFASIPLMFHEVVEVRSWMDGRTFLNGIALGQVTPGPIVITATFIGYLLSGPLGALVATIGVFLPSFLILVGAVPYFDRFRGSVCVNKVMSGILSSFVGLLLSVTIRFAANVPWDLPRIILGVAAFVALILRVDILWIVLIGTIVSVIVL
ncbi:MAG: chromate efflux transporter [Proteobacteria bacterium]|nr:chromate efflux transporter [Pseudomonadota bacterium]